MITRPRILLKKGKDRRVSQGHPWVFSNEVGSVEGPVIDPGDLVEVRRVDGAPLGVGLYHPHSLIAVRLLGWGRDALSLTSLDAELFRARLAAAQARRERALGPEATRPPAAYRLCHAEADGLPGVVVDRYADVLSVQIAALGMERRRDALFDALEELFSPRAIVLRGEGVWREQEGLSPEVAVVRGDWEAGERVEIAEHGLRYGVDPLRGQKTGWFLDQREHRWAVRPFARCARCLDLCSYEGGFALNALAAGATSVLAVDVSESALAALRANAVRNGLDDRLSVRAADVFELAGGDPPGAEGQPAAPYDVVVLDPPNLTRTRKAVPAAKRAYRRLNAAALRWLAPGGVLATASCSHHLYEETFLALIGEAAAAAGRRLRVLHRGFQPADHPVLLAMPETRYLKFFVLQAV